MPAASATDAPVFEGLTVVDADLHVYPDPSREVADRLPDRFRGKGVAAPDGNWASPIGRFDEGTSPDNGVPGSDPAYTAEHHLDRHGIDRAVITGGGVNLRASALPDVRYAHALTAAYNEWLAETWLEADDRYLGSISVSPLAPERAAEEIHRWADHPDMVQVVVGSGTQIPLGQETYWPIYEAAESEGLPVAIHAGAEGYGVAYPNSGAGYPSTYLERKVVQPCTAMGQLLSLVLEGVPIQYPDLDLVFVGSGYGWLPSFLWRADKNWKGPSHDVPWVERPPSEYVRENVAIVTQRIDEAGSAEDFRRTFAMAHAGELLVYGSSYPHWDGHVPDPGSLDLDPADVSAIFGGRSSELYDL